MNEKLVNIGDKLKIAGVGTLVVSSFVAGQIEATPQSEIFVEENPNKAKEELVIEKRIPTYDTVSFTVSSLNQQIEEIQFLKEQHEGYLQTFIRQLEEAKDKDEAQGIQRQIDVAMSRITSYNDTITYYQNLLTETQPELNKVEDLILENFIE